MDKTKILAIHLPAFHEVDINNKWWGEGFTEWDNVKSGKKLYKNHYQPIIPYNNDYYDLTKKESLNRQAQLSKMYGIDGFIFYHYWFGNNVQIFEKPTEIILENRDIDVNYCFCWANESWITTWHGKNPDTMIEQVYGNEQEWKKHFNYLLKFFLDDRYIKIEGKPVLFVYKPNEIECYDEMVNKFNLWSIENQFNGIYFVEYISSKNRSLSSNLSSAVMEFEPLYTTFFDISIFNKAKRYICKKMHIIDYQNYDSLWKKNIKRSRKYSNKKIIKGCFVGWDNSARKGKQSMIVKKSSPAKFEKYLYQLITNNRPNCSNMVVINAWNEWSEGAYLEPDTKNKFSYLEAVKRVKEKLK